MNATMSAVKLTPFRKILIANRGEIALRVMRTAKRLGYETVAVYSTADGNARHVREADQAVWIGESQPSQSYLRIDAIVEAAKNDQFCTLHAGTAERLRGQHAGQVLAHQAGLGAAAADARQRDGLAGDEGQAQAAAQHLAAAFAGGGVDFNHEIWCS